jgi:hypothetical protein
MTSTPPGVSTRRVLATLLVTFSTLGSVPVVGAHGTAGHSTATLTALSGLLVIGLLVVGASLHLGRTRWRDSPERVDAGVVFGVVTTALSLGAFWVL